MHWVVCHHRRPGETQFAALGLEARIAALLGPGAWFGETALLLQERHAIGAQTVEHALLARISSEAVIRLLRADGAFALMMLKETARRLRSSMVEATEIASPVRKRVIGFLLDELASLNAEKGAATIVLPRASRWSPRGSARLPKLCHAFFGNSAVRS